MPSQKQKMYLQGKLLFSGLSSSHFSNLLLEYLKTLQLCNCNKRYKYSRFSIYSDIQIPLELVFG